MHVSFAILGLALVSTQTFAVSPFIIYGEDNRVDTMDASQNFQRLALSAAARIPKERINIRGNVAELIGTTLSDKVMDRSGAKVCEKERFSHQPTAADCSGFLVAPDLLVTAGHCMALSACEKYSWVFDYRVEDRNQTAVSVYSSSVYNCKEVIRSEQNYFKDFAVIRLDRRVADRAPLKISSREPSRGTNLVMIGHPTGLPQKVTDKAKITSVDTFSFQADLDAFGGNSGSAVLNAQTGEVLGILVNGATDYRLNTRLNCVEVNVVSTEGTEGISSWKQFSSFIK